MSGSSDKTVRVWDLAAAKQQSDPTSEPLPPSLREGLVAYYPFNGNARDESGNGHHGEVHGANLTDDRFGTLTNAITLNGVSDWVDATLDKDLAGPFSLSMWMLMPDAANGKYQSLISQHTKDGAGNFSAVFNLQVQPDGQLDYFMGNGTDYGVSFPGPTLDQKSWSHLCVVFDGQEARLSLDRLPGPCG